jgi:hypothetical protein
MKKQNYLSEFAIAEEIVKSISYLEISILQNNIIDCMVRFI